MVLLIALCCGVLWSCSEKDKPSDEISTETLSAEVSTALKVVSKIKEVEVTGERITCTVETDVSSLDLSALAIPEGTIKVYADEARTTVLTTVTLAEGENDFYLTASKDDVVIKCTLKVKRKTVEQGSQGSGGGQPSDEKKWSTGLAFTLLDDDRYSVVGIGTCSDSDLVIPASYEGKDVTSIGDWAFRDCTGLTSVTIPSSVTSIGGWAFSGCTGLTSVTIPDSVTSIGKKAFEGCTGLTSVMIPSGVTSIGERVFEGCSIIVDEANAAYKSIDGVLYSKDGMTLIQYPAGKSGAFTIPDRVTSIGPNSFYGCSGLTSMIIPNSVTSIGEYAFEACTGLTLMMIGSGVTSIGKGGILCFEHETKESALTSIIVDEANTAYKSIDGVLYSKDGMTLIQYPAGKTGAFTIPDSVTSIGEEAFACCRDLTEVTIPNGVTSIGYEAFAVCTGLTSVTIPESVTSIGEGAFSGCTELTFLTFAVGSQLTSIGDWAFQACSELTSLSIPSRVTSIGEHAFSYCSGLTSVTIPGSVTSIGSSAFSGCTGLTSVTIPGSVTSIGEGAFSGCAGLTSIRGSADNVSEVARRCGSSSYTVTITSGTSVGSSAFRYCKGLTSVTITANVTIIGELAFEGCTGLTSLSIPMSVTSIEAYAFGGCKNLTDIYYGGTEEQWNTIEKSLSCINDMGNCVIHYTD